jgi:ribosomal protein S18 acetylase RimI-like enzyme
MTRAPVSLARNATRAAGAATVRRATREDVPRLARAMARAFYDDPVAQWILRDDARRLRRLERWFALTLRRAYLPRRECYTTDDVVGGALWMPPGKWKPGPIAQLRVLPGMVLIKGREFFRAATAFGFLEAMHPRERHYFLPFIGVDPERQGRGIGSALMRPVLDRCDREGVPAFLEATTPRSRTFYRRNGFEVVDELRYGNGGPPTWRMWREPRS